MPFVESPMLWRKHTSTSSPTLFVDSRRAAPVPPAPLKPFTLPEISQRKSAGHVKCPESIRSVSCMDAIFDFFIHGAESLCQPFATRPRKRTEEEQEPPPRRWYRLHPEEGDRYFVRPDAGLRGRIPGAPRRMTRGQDESQEQPDVELVKSQRKKHFRRTRSTPPELERWVGLPSSLGFELDAFKSACRVCYENPVEVVILPCRHGVMCESCLRRIQLSRVARKGGCKCPVCRSSIQEVVWIYGEAAIPQYGFTVRLD